MKSVSIFCGSRLGTQSIYKESAQAVGKLLAQKKIRIIYGGAQIGIMGEVANSALENGGEVVGVIPGFLSEKEIAHTGLTELITCNSMHERKQKMFELSEGFIALPGGFGTFDEICEILTWRQLESHSFPIGFLNISGYYDALAKQIHHSVQEGFITKEHSEIPYFESNIESLLNKMSS